MVKPENRTVSVLLALIALSLLASLVSAQQVAAPVNQASPDSESDSNLGERAESVEDLSANDGANATLAIEGFSDSETSEKLPKPASDALLGFLSSIIRDNIPSDYLDDKDWNKTKQVYAGIKFRREGLKLETERRWKIVNHGRWRQYQVQLVDPERTLDVRLSDVHWMQDGRLHVHLSLASELIVKIWQTLWNLGVKLYAIRTEAHVTVVLDIDAVVGFRFDQSTFPPALVVEPEVLQSSLTMSRFEVDRIGKLGGDLAEELGDAAENVIRNLIVEKQSEKLTSKLNRQIEKKKDKLRLDVSDWGYAIGAILKK